MVDLKKLAVSIKQKLAVLQHSYSTAWTQEYTHWRNHFLSNRLRLTLRIALAVVSTDLVWDFSRAVVTADVLAEWDVVIDVVVVLCLLLGFRLLRTFWSKRYPGLLFLGFSWSVVLIPQIGEALIHNGAPNINIWTLTFLAQATLIPVRWFLHLVSQLSAPITYLVVNKLFGLGLDKDIISNPRLYFYLFWFCGICDLSVFLYERLQRAEFSLRRELEVERDRSEELLLNILPQPIAERLKQQPQILADHFSDATVLFADLVGFTQLSSQVSATELVMLLNQLFSIFDELTEQHGVEKIKTIGDAYMAVAGLPNYRSDHVKICANLALDMQKAVAQFNIEYNQLLSIRIGIHTGPVVAGVIGIKRFIYDLWGDTVNIASRMESHGLSNTIQVSEAIYDCLKEEYLFEKRGIISVKGMGEMTVYLLMGKDSRKNSK